MDLNLAQAQKQHVPIKWFNGGYYSDILIFYLCLASSITENKQLFSRKDFDCEPRFQTGGKTRPFRGCVTGFTLTQQDNSSAS